VRSVFAALRGRLVGWGKLERKATVAAAFGRLREAAPDPGPATSPVGIGNRE